MRTFMATEPEEKLIEHEENIDDQILYQGGPSLLALTNTFVYGLLLLILAGFLMFYPLERLMPAENASRYGSTAGIILAAIALLYVLKKVVELKMISYSVTNDRIEWERGLISRKIDNIDLFRIVDLRLHRSLFEIMLGIGTVKAFTSDKTEPEFDFKHVRNPRALYDILKKASLEGDRRRGTIHVE